MTATLSSKQDVLLDTLTGLCASMSDVRGAVIATVDGIPITHTMNLDSEAGRAAAMAATALGLGRRINDVLGSGHLTDMSVRGEHGQVYIYAAGKKAVLGVVATRDANVGLLHIKAREAARQIATLL